MDRNIFRYVLRYSARAQVITLIMTVASFPFLYATLELPKIIINDALASGGARERSSARRCPRCTTCSRCAASSCSWC